MKLETFFDTFDLFADAPNAVAKMRELVLELAVRGRLVVQNIADEPAAQLLKRVFAEKIRRTGRGECLDKEQCPAADETFDIPVSWEWIGATTPAVMVSDQGKKVQTKDILESGKYPVVDQGKMFIRGYCDDSDKVINVAEPIVLFGDHTRETKFIDFDFVVGADGVKLLQPICINPRFYFLVLRWLPLESRGYARHFKLLKASRIPLPPLSEQKRIVAKVDELMALCDRLEAQQQEWAERKAELARAALARFADAPTPANLEMLFYPSPCLRASVRKTKAVSHRGTEAQSPSAYLVSPADLRKSILTLAVQGKLVPQDPNDEPAEKFLNRTKACHSKSCNGSKFRREEGTVAIADDEIPFAIPDSWAWCRLETITDKVTDGEHLSPVKTASGMPLLTATHVTARGVTLSNSQYVSVEDGHKSRQRCDPTRGDILICSRGTIGRCAVVEIDEVFCLMGSVILLRFPAESSPRYFNCFLSTDLAQTEMRGMSGATAVQALYLKDIRQSLVPVPPLAEQRRIVAKVEQLMALVAELETQLAASRASGEKLLTALVAELTAGKESHAAA
jgi:type I restriction enzyme S subunit